MTKPAQAIEAAQKANAIIYVILIADRPFYGYGPFAYTGAAQMKKLTEETGGRMIDVGTNGKKLEAAFEQMNKFGNRLRDHDQAAPTTHNNAEDGHEITSWRHAGCLRGLLFSH